MEEPNSTVRRKPRRGLPLVAVMLTGAALAVAMSDGTPEWLKPATAAAPPPAVDAADRRLRPQPASIPAGDLDDGLEKRRNRLRSSRDAALRRRADDAQLRNDPAGRPRQVRAAAGGGLHARLPRPGDAPPGVSASDLE